MANVAKQERQPQDDEISAPLRARMDAGLAAREAAPLETHSTWETPSGRADPVAVLEAQNATRVPELVPIRHGRMIVSPFTFYRGGAAIMAADLAAGPQSGLRMQTCGDAHLSNFGYFAAPDRRLVFDLNDFDETLPAPFEWDVKRLVASVVVAARDNGHRPKEQKAAARATAAGYRKMIGNAAEMRFLDVWYARIDAEELLQRAAAAAPKARQKRIARNLAQGAHADEPRLARQVRRAHRRGIPDPRAAAADRAHPRRSKGGDRARHRSGAARLHRDAPARSPPGPRPLPLRRRGAQGRRRGLRGHRGADGPPDGRPRRRPAVPPGQAGPGVGALAVRGSERLRAPRRARRARASG